MTTERTEPRSEAGVETAVAPRGRRVAAAVRDRAGRLESLAALVVCLGISIWVSRNLLRDQVVSADALVHQYWMWQFRDPALFTDPLTDSLRESARYPDGYVGLFRIATQFFDPIAFGEWLGIALMGFSAWLIFVIVRDHAAWKPAAWIGALLFLSLVDVHRFHGGFPRAFVHPVVLLTVLLSMRRHRLAAALVAAGGSLIYPPASLLAVGVLVVSVLSFDGWRPKLDLDRARYAVLAGVLALAGVLGPRLIHGAPPQVLTEAEARSFPDFGTNGPLHYFADTTLKYLTQNRSGFDLRTPGSVLVLAGLALLLFRRANWRLLSREVIALPVVALTAFGVAHAVLFQLYLPHRYTYPLLAFFSIAIAVALRPTWDALSARSRPWARGFAVLAMPVVVGTGIAIVTNTSLGAKFGFDHTGSLATVATAIVAVVAAAGLALLVRRLGVSNGAALGAALTGLAILGAILIVPVRPARGSGCPASPTSRYLSTLPKDAIIAGDPSDMKCLPKTARRAVVTSTQLSPSYEVDYFRKGRARMFALLQAQYGPRVQSIVDLQKRYGATHLWVRRGAVRRELRFFGDRWRGWERPFGRFVRDIVRTQTRGDPAVLRLPPACRTFRSGESEVYDIACIARVSGAPPRG